MKDFSFGTIPFRTNEGEIEFLVVWQVYGGGHWVFPKGHPKDGETPLETALRETLEETGLVPKEIISREPINHKYNFVHDRKEIEKTIGYFVILVDGGKISLQSSEVKGYKWMTIEEILETSPFPDLCNVAKQAHSIASAYLMAQR